MIGIISDIHGNYVALQTVLAQLDRTGISKVICLGDVVGYYCQVNECCEELLSRNIFTIQGNHDWYLATNQKCPRSNSANRCLDYQREIITTENLDWIRSLRTSATYQDLHLVHGGWNDPIHEYVVPSNNYFKHLDGQYFCSGHTHIPIIWVDRKKSYCNPGSVGQPRDGDPRASFAIWDGKKFTLHRVAYNYGIVQLAMVKAGFEPYFYENLAIGVRIGSNIDKKTV